MTPNKRLICDYMHYAFLPSSEKAAAKAAWYGSLLGDRSVPVFDATDPESVRRLLARIISDRLRAHGVDRVKLGVSSGMDSRGILGGLLEVLPADRIVAYTNGEPGNPDFETARRFTQARLREHHFFELTEGKYVLDKIVADTAARRPQGTTWQLSGKSSSSMPPEIADLPNLHGFLGDSISGKRLKGKIETDWQEAVTAFVRTNRVFASAYQKAGLEPRVDYEWLPADYDPFHAFPDRPFLSAEVMSYGDQLDLCYRQEQRIRLSAQRFHGHEIDAQPPAVRETLRALSAKRITVYDDPRWQRSFLLLPPEQRLNQRFLKATWATLFPDIFADLLEDEPAPAPVPKEPARAALDRLARTASHTNWERQWQTNASFRNMVETAFTSLAARRLVTWFDPMAILSEIRKDVVGMGREIFGVCSLEIGIRAGHLPDQL